MIIKSYLVHKITGKKIFLLTDEQSNIRTGFYWKYVYVKDSPYLTYYYNTGQIQSEKFLESLQEGICQISYYKSGKIHKIDFCFNDNYIHKSYFKDGSVREFSLTRDPSNSYIYEKLFYKNGSLKQHHIYNLNESNNILVIINMRSFIYHRNKKIKKVKKINGYLTKYKYYGYISYINYFDSSKTYIKAKIEDHASYDHKQNIIIGIDNIRNFLLLS